MNPYVFIREVKDQILISQFGFITNCKHTPTCSVQMKADLKKHGLFLGFLKGTMRVLTCFGRKELRNSF